MSIDTIRVSVPLQERDYRHFLELADPVRFFKVDTAENRVLWTKVKGLADMTLPSHAPGVHWDIRDPKPGEYARVFERLAKRDQLGAVVEGIDDFKLLDLEFSLPKFIRGHNIDLLYEPWPALKMFKDQLELAFNYQLPRLDEWFVSRLDICHAYRFDNQEVAQLVIDSLKTKKFPYKKPQIYEGAVFFPGREFSFKVYLKHLEYKAHSFRKDLKAMNDRALYLREYSKGVLRIETSLRPAKLRKLIGIDYPLLGDVLDLVDDKGETVYNKFLRGCYGKFFGEGQIVNEEDKVSQIFKAFCPKRKANEMMRLWCMVQFLGEMKARKHMGDATWFRYKSDLKECGVKNTSTYAAAINNFSFEIPHPVFSVNQDDSDLLDLYAVHGILELPEGEEVVSAIPPKFEEAV